MFAEIFHGPVSLIRTDCNSLGRGEKVCENALGGRFYVFVFKGVLFLAGIADNGYSQ